MGFFKLVFPEIFSCERTMGFPMKSLLQTEEALDFEKIREGEIPKSALVLELGRLSFDPETQKTLFKEQAIVTS